MHTGQLSRVFGAYPRFYKTYRRFYNTYRCFYNAGERFYKTYARYYKADARYYNSHLRFYNAPSPTLRLLPVKGRAPHIRQQPGQKSDSTRTDRAAYPPPTPRAKFPKRFPPTPPILSQKFDKMEDIAYSEAVNAEKCKRTESEQRAEARLKLEKTAHLTYLLTAPKSGNFFFPLF